MAAIGVKYPAMRRLLLPILALFLFAAAPVRADTFRDGLVAYEKGDYATAARVFRRLAEQGSPAARINLGVMYAEGKGVPKDYVQAHMWFNLATSKDKTNAVKFRDTLASKMTPAQLAEAQRLAREWQAQHPGR